MVSNLFIERGKFPVDGYKISSHFPELVIIFICLVRFIFVVTKTWKSKNMMESVSFHSVSIKGHEVLS